MFSQFEKGSIFQSSFLLENTDEDESELQRMTTPVLSQLNCLSPALIERKDSLFNYKEMIRIERNRMLTACIDNY